MRHLMSKGSVGFCKCFRFETVSGACTASRVFSTAVEGLWCLEKWRTVKAARNKELGSPVTP